MPFMLINFFIADKIELKCKLACGIIEAKAIRKYYLQAESLYPIIGPITP